MILSFSLCGVQAEKTCWREKCSHLFETVSVTDFRLPISFLPGEQDLSRRLGRLRARRVDGCQGDEAEGGGKHKQEPYDVGKGHLGLSRFHGEY